MEKRHNRNARRVITITTGAVARIKNREENPKKDLCR